MKVCPSCNANVAEQAVSCPKCGHDYDGGRAQKKTMMGFPSLGGEESDDEVDSQGGVRFPSSGSDDAKDDDDEVVKTEVVSPDELPFDFDGFGEVGGEESEGSTRQVDPSSVFDALRGDSEAEEVSAKSTSFGLPSIEAGDKDGDDEDGGDEAASAWGLGAASSVGDDEGATQVVDPDTLSGIDLGEESSDGQDQRFGTLMGMSLEEQEGQQTGAGAMQLGGLSGDDDSSGEEHAATAALSADELSKLDEMGFGDDSDHWEEEENEDNVASPGGRLKPGGGQQGSPDENLKTAVLDSSTAPKGFQLPKPEAKTDSPARQQKAQDKTSPKEPQDNKAASAPQSGVFRSVRRRKKNTDGQNGPEGRKAQKDSGVLGTGTYQMSNTDATSGTQEELDDQKLKLGAVEGARTSFPTGEEDEAPETRDAGVKVPTGADDAPSTGAEVQKPSKPESRTPSTGPRFDIGTGIGGPSSSSTPGGQEPKELEDIRDIEPVDEVEAIEGPKSTPRGPSPIEEVALQPEPADEGIAAVDASPSPQGGALAPGGPSQDGPQPGYGAQSSPEQSIEESSPASSPQPQPAGFSANPSESVPQSSQAGAFGSSPTHQAAPQAGADDFGSQPAPQAQPQSQSGGFGAQQAPQAQRQPRAAASPQAQQQKPSQKTPSQDGEAENSDLERIVTFAQKGSGLVGGVVLVLVAIIAVITGGIPEAGAARMVLFAALLFGVGALALTPLKMATKLKSAVYGLVAMAVLLAFLASLAVEMGMILAIGQFAGAIFLFFAAGFPLLGKLAAR